MKYLNLFCALIFCSCSLTHNLHRNSTYAKAKFIPKKVELTRVVDTISMTNKVVDVNGDTLSLLSDKDFTIDENGEQMRSVAIGAVSVLAKTRVVAERMGKVGLDFVINLPCEMQNRCYLVIITPTLHRNESKELLDELSIRGALLSKVQERDYWQFDRYKRRLSSLALFDTVLTNKMARDIIRYPYPKGVRLDSVVQSQKMVSYHYTQEVAVGESSKKMLVTLGGRVVALDGSSYRMPSVDTLVYNISSMLAFVDTTTRHITKVVDKYATVQDKNYLTFKVGNTSIVDTLGSNGEQLSKIKTLMHSVIEQQDFLIDSIILTASSSPDGSYAHNAKLSAERAKSLAAYLKTEVDPYNDYGFDTLLTVRSIAEDWAEFGRLLTGDNADAIRAMIDATKDYDDLEVAIRKRYPDHYKHILKNVYPCLRSVSFRYALRRKGMVKDTIHTTELDTLYARGVEYLKVRNYAKALYHLHSYRDQNSAVAMLSMGYDNEAFEVLQALPPTAINRYLLAIACTRLGRYKEGKAYYDESCAIDEKMRYRGNLDPEIFELRAQSSLLEIAEQ